MPKPRTPPKRPSKSPVHAAATILPTRRRRRPRAAVDPRHGDERKLMQGLLELLDMVKVVNETLRGVATKADVAELIAYLRNSRLATEAKWKLFLEEQSPPQPLVVRPEESLG